MSLKIRLFFLMSLLFVQTARAQNAGGELMRFWIENRFKGCENMAAFVQEGSTRNAITLE